MLGRLARYLRFVGCDTVYGRGMSDDELLATAAREGRILLTRDRPLSRRGRQAFLIDSPELARQWRAVRAAWPEVPIAPAFSRCTRCNGELEPVVPEDPRAASLPPGVRGRRTAVFACRSCGHLYWEGSHTESVRRRLAAWEGPGAER